MSSPLAGTTLSENEQASLVYTLSDYFARRPALESVAPGLVRAMLEHQYPSLGERLTHAALIEPEPCGDEVQYRVLSLARLLIERFLGNEKLHCPAGSYLTLYPGAEYPQKLPLSVVTLDTLLNEWAPLLLEAYKQHLVDFWSLPLEQDVAPWQRLSEFFAAQLRQACVALSGEELATVRAVLDYPDLEARRAKFGSDCAQAYIPIIDTRVKDPDPLHVQALVLSRWVGKRQIVLLYSLFGGIEAFDSTEALEASLGLTLSGQDSDFRNYSPDHHVFDALTVTLLIRQLEAIETIKPGDYRDLATLERRLHELTGLQTLFGAFRSGHETKLGQLRDLLPGWLCDASPPDRTLYGRYVASLAAVHRRHAGKAFLDGIPDILTFARKALQVSLEKECPEAAPVSVGEISLTLTRGTNSSVELANKSFDPAGFRDETQTQDYAVQALKNLAGFPRTAFVQVYYRGETAPAWMNHEALRTAVSDADIGKTYPDLLRQKLQHDLAERARQEGLFIDYLRVLLPMLALERRLNLQLTERAWRYVEAVVRQDVGVPQVLGQRIVVRPLAFLAHPNAEADRVRDMFVIGPQATDQGPLVLCRLGVKELLLEFPSWAGLLTAIQEEGPLQQSVLDGLESARRSTYDHGGFKEPHLIRVTNADWNIPDTPEPASLDTTPLSGSFCAALFAATVEALIARAEADSVSNAEDRWSCFVDLGWALFDLLQPLLPGPLANFGLLVQLLSSLKTFEDPNASQPWAAFADVLLNLAVVLVYHSRPLLGKAGVGGGKPIIGNVLIKEPVASASNQLVFAWTRPDRHFTASELVRLEKFKLPLSEAPGTLLESGDWKGLYQRDKLFYARVDDTWFRVSRKLDGVVIIDDLHPALQGPWLKSDGTGRWQLDRGPRLLGGVGELSVRARKKLKSLEKKARDLLASLPARLADAERRANVVQVPRDIEDILVTKAQPFDDLGRELSVLTQGISQCPQYLIDDLERAASTLVNKGLNLRISLTKKRLPSTAAVEFLMEEEQITIRKLGERRDISGGKGNDFLDEYEIRDRQGRPLWYAHFHYRTATAPVTAFSKAHLKTREQRFKGLSFQRAQESAGSKVDAIWRGDISPKAAAALFLAPSV